MREVLTRLLSSGKRHRIFSKICCKFKVHYKEINYMRLILILKIIVLMSISTIVTAQNRLMQFVDLHNEERASLGLNDLQWSDELAGQAQQWANAMAFKDQASHSGSGYGENIWFGDNNSATIEEMFELWLSEKQYFIESQPVPDNCSQSWDKCGHYSQIVWSRTSQIGCAAAASQSNDYVVCRYDPPGNIQGQKAY